MVKIEDIKPGDKITTEHTVSSVRNGKVYGRLCIGDNSRFALEEIVISADTICSHTPKPREFKIGDRVRYASRTHIIRGIHDGKAWLPHSNTIQVLLDELQHTTD